MSTISAYVFISHLGYFWYIGLVSIVWHLLVLVFTHRLVYGIRQLRGEDLDLLRYVESSTIETVSEALPSIRRISRAGTVAPAA